MLQCGRNQSSLCSYFLLFIMKSTISDYSERIVYMYVYLKFLNLVLTYFGTRFVYLPSILRD